MSGKFQLMFLGRSVVHGLEQAAVSRNILRCSSRLKLLTVLVVLAALTTAPIESFKSRTLTWPGDSCSGIPPQVTFYTN